MNRCGRTSKLLDLARRVRSETIDGDGERRTLVEAWKTLGGVKLLPGRRGTFVDKHGVRRREYKRRERDPPRTYAERRKQRRGWQD